MLNGYGTPGAVHCFLLPRTSLGPPITSLCEEATFFLLLLKEDLRLARHRHLLKATQLLSGMAST